MATKIVVRDEFCAPDDMADIDYSPMSWDDMEAPDSAVALDVVPDMERDYFNARRIAKLEALADKRQRQAKHWDKAHTPEFELLSEVCNELNMSGAHSVALEYRPGQLPVLTAGTKDHYQLARVNGDGATVYAKHTVTRMTPRGQDTTTQIVGYAVESATLIESIRALAPARVPVRTHSALRVETGKVSRKKWQANQARKNSHDTGVERDMLRNDKQRAMYAMRESITERLARGELITRPEWKIALGRPLTDAEVSATKRYRRAVLAGKTVDTRTRTDVDGGASAMTRLINSLERK